MTWSLANAVDHNRTALLSVLAALCALVGIAPGEYVPNLRRSVRSKVLRVLRGAESAARRLVVVEGVQLLKQGFVIAPRAAPDGPPRRRPRRKGTGNRAHGLPLFDPRKCFEPNAGKRKYAKHAPRIFFFDGSDPPFVEHTEPPEPKPDDLLDASRLCKRLAALQDVLTDLSRHAKRYARWKLRLDATPPKPGRWIQVLRPGRPPGHRTRQTHAVDAILSDCHALAHYALQPPDTG